MQKTKPANNMTASQNSFLRMQDHSRKNQNSQTAAAYLAAAPVFGAVWWLATFHTRAVSHEAVTARWPSGLKRAERTSSSWRIGWPIALPLVASQGRAVLSADAVTTSIPSGLN
jgi:hypothetical protein